MSKVTVVSSAVRPRLRLNLVASERIDAGKVVFSCQPDGIVRERTRRTIQIGHNRHVKSELLNCVDHRCDPNAVLVIETLQS